MATIATSGSAIAKAGENIDTSITSGWTADSEYEKWLEEGEAYICTLAEYDIVSNWASLNSTYKKLFTEYVSSYAAIQCIKYNMAGYSSRVEAEDMINILWARMNKIESIIKNSSKKDFLGV
ncbi:MAG: hypothetical protein DRZ76_02660 [Candidatus Nealsonbacteria bacterium]|nr:MAG: hypothetical protein DRZ76_02660 [Candidatus Nealsonbacteria bacterium]